MAGHRSMEVGVRYAADGSRLVAGVVAVSVDRRRVLVVESTNRVNHWVLPKGGYETDEARPEDAASREAWEEAGITGRITRALGEIRDLRPPAKGLPRSEEDRWPEMHKRKRRWLTYEEAKSCFQSMNRPELIEALDRSSVLR
ncbi:NUDIX hydrolase domain-like protein [Trichophaea hybrida]|nr:NUDIX hydrolase domain-like protein [Trichophaea hybrida]